MSMLRTPPPNFFACADHLKRLPDAEVTRLLRRARDVLSATAAWESYDAFFVDAPVLKSVVSSIMYDSLCVCILFVMRSKLASEELRSALRKQTTWEHHIIDMLIEERDRVPEAIRHRVVPTRTVASGQNVAHVDSDGQKFEVSYSVQIDPNGRSLSRVSQQWI
jgi:hypothetical protein